VDEDVRKSVRVPGHEVVRVAQEADVASVGRDRTREARAVRLGPVARDVDALGRRELTIAHEDVVRAVEVPGNEVVGFAPEDHETTVGRRPLLPGPAVRLHSADADAHPLRRVVREVPQEDVVDAVGVPRHDVAGRGREQDESPVGGDHGSGAFGAQLRAR